MVLEWWRVRSAVRWNQRLVLVSPEVVINGVKLNGGAGTYDWMDFKQSTMRSRCIWKDSLFRSSDCLYYLPTGR